MFVIQASFVVLVLKDGTGLNDFQIVALSVGLPYSVLWNIFGWITVSTLNHFQIIALSVDLPYS
jgi:hypothetical protein